MRAAQAMALATRVACNKEGDGNGGRAMLQGLQASNGNVGDGNGESNNVGHGNGNKAGGQQRGQEELGQGRQG